MNAILYSACIQLESVRSDKHSKEKKKSITLVETGEFLTIL